jgi:hypothetical protein
MTADVACGASWLLQVPVEGAVSYVAGAEGRSHGQKRWHPKRCLTPAATVGQDLETYSGLSEPRGSLDSGADPGGSSSSSSVKIFWSSVPNR